MNKQLLLWIVLAAFLKLGISASDFYSCRDKKCARKAEMAKRSILNIDWKPISVFPEESNRFRLKQKIH